MRPGEMTPLPKPSIDTGGGLERWAAVLQGVRSTWESDSFTPLIARAGELANVAPGSSDEQDVSLRVVADHARALTFLIGDGVLPSNAGRGYVLRRILRRGSRHGKLLGQDKPFIHSVADAVIDEMGEAYPELVDRRAYITDRIQREEERFLETLTKGMDLLEGEIEELKAKGVETLPGETVFRLYDTFGFPIDLTADILVGHGMALDQAGFDEAMSEQKTRARAAWKGSGDTAVQEVYGRIASDVETTFRGYEALEFEAPVTAMLQAGEAISKAVAGDEVELIFEETPFYAESGGQMGDRGRITTATGEVEVRRRAEAGRRTLRTSGRRGVGRDRGRSGGRSSRSTPSRGRRRCETIRERICCMRRCARRSASRRCRRDRSSGPSACASTSRTTRRSRPPRSKRSKIASI